MFTFIILNLCLGFLLENESFLHTLLQSKFSLYTGSLLMIVNVIATGFKFKYIPFKLRYDLFAVGSLLVWFSYWPPFFRMGTPIFNSFPVYFAFITALFSLIFITNRGNIDPDSLDFLQWLSDSGRFNPVIIMLGTLISLAFPEHFLLFPVTITILIVRFTVACSLDNE